MQDRVATERRENFVGLRSGDVAFVQDPGRELRTRYTIDCATRNPVGQYDRKINGRNNRTGQCTGAVPGEATLEGCYLRP